MDIRHIAKLANLEITDEEVLKYTPQMTKIVDYIEQLNELDTTEIEASIGGFTEEGESTSALREDRIEQSFSQEEALAEAPKARDGHFQVPKVL